MKTCNSWLCGAVIGLVVSTAAVMPARGGVISAGYYDSFGTKSDGSAWAWGYNGGTINNYTDAAQTQTVALATGALGLGSTNNMVNGEYVASPAQIGAAKTWSDLVGNQYRSYGIMADGTLWGWGYDGSPISTYIGSDICSRSHYEQAGALGIGAQGCQIITSVFDVVSVSTNYEGGGGNNDVNTPYMNVTTYIYTYTNTVMNGLVFDQPVQVGSDDKWVQVVSASGAGGKNVAYGLKNDGTLWSWGYDGLTQTSLYDTNGVSTGTMYQTHGRLGQGNMLAGATNVLGGQSYIYLYQHYTNDGAGNYTNLLYATTNNITLAITTSIVYYARTLNEPTQITTPALTALDAGGSALLWTCVAAGSQHGAATRSDGTLWTWGKNQEAFVNSVFATNYGDPYGRTNYYAHDLIAVSTNGSVLGLNDTVLFATNVPTQVGSDSDWVSVCVGLNADFTLAIKADGTLWGWGNNGYSATYSFDGGHGTSYTDTNPSATTYVFSAYAKGYLGMGSNTFFVNAPMQVGENSDWAYVSAGAAHCLGIKSDGSLYAWGDNGSGRLGIGRTDAYADVPTQIGTDKDWVFVSAGFNHSLGLKSDGSLYAWGNNTYAALGDQSGDAYEPVKISSGWGYSAPVVAASENGSGDYDGDHRTDFVIYESSTGAWLVRLSSAGYALFTLDALLGGPGYKLVAADFDGDGVTDPGVYQESSGAWLVKKSGSGYAQSSHTLGGPGYTAVPDDYDGDRLADYAVYNKSTGEWRISLSRNAYTTTILKTMRTGCVPVPADYDGDMIVDLMVYESSTGSWQIMLGNTLVSLPWHMGGNNYTAVPMDYDGDAKADPAVYEKSTGVWKIMLSSAGYWQYDSSVYGWMLGGSGFVSTPADYDGDGKVDPTVYDLASGQWTIMLSASGYYRLTTTWTW